MKERLAPLVNAIKVNLVGAFNDFRDKANAVKDKLAELKEKFQPVVDIISGAFSSGVSSASDLFDKIKTKIGDFAEGALTKLNNGITIARDGFQKFSEFAGRLWEKLDPLVTLIRDNLVNSLQNLKEPIETIKQAFSTIGDTIFNHLLPALRDALMPVWESLKSALGGVAGILGGAFVGALGVAIGAISGIVKAISGFAKAFSGIVEIVGIHRQPCAAAGGIDCIHHFLGFLHRHRLILCAVEGPDGHITQLVSIPVHAAAANGNDGGNGTHRHTDLP